MAAPTSQSATQSARPAVFLHVGAAKSGTTYLQNVLWHNRDRLRRHGFNYPGRDPAAHVRAAFDLRRTFFRDASDPSTRGAWHEIVGAARDFPGTTIISQELFAPARIRYTRQAMADLDFADVHVVFTVRDLARQLPAHWQEDVKNRFTTTFDDFVAALRRADWRSFETARLFWGLQDPVAVLARWGVELPPERVHVVTLPPPGAPRDLLWQRFCAAVGLAPWRYDLAGSFSNPSLGLAETLFLRDLNDALDERVGWHVYNEQVKLHLAQEVLTARRAPTKIALSADDLMWATERAIETVEDLRAAGYHVVGDLYDLIPTAPRGRPSAAPSGAEMADVGTDAIAALLRRLLEEDRRGAGVEGSAVPVADRIGLLRAETAALAERTARLAHDAAPLSERAAERYPAVRQLRGAYRRIQRGGRSDVETNTG
ncbi:hypothetical protein [Actinomadura verrucosospora]|uniref:Sulfotransferase family protein n=1 Tax=Actinomadura verrucosospora TaxID=46165 RepID=A0A7D3VX03_ACTVE|nr:hypothetical protein [Actinomadura verrucosospora]QKG24738.1 hypothetical protein ACTIVE_6387 [Actinomadura verrucosospora]